MTYCLQSLTRSSHKIIARQFWASSGSCSPCGFMNLAWEPSFKKLAIRCEPWCVSVSPWIGYDDIVFKKTKRPNVFLLRVTSLAHGLVRDCCACKSKTGTALHLKSRRTSLPRVCTSVLFLPVALIWTFCGKWKWKEWFANVWLKESVVILQGSNGPASGV